MPFLEKLLRSKAFIWTLLVLPGLWPLWPIFVRPDPSVTADALKYVLHHLGFVACILLATVLAFTPLRVLWPKWGVSQALNRHRRLVGVAAFVYAALHLIAHLIYEGGFEVSAIPATLKTALTKPFQLTGLIAFSILLVLAVTSPNAAIKWLGGKLWKNIHRLAYVAAGLAAYHQAAARKVFPMQVLWIFVPLALLEVARIWRQRNPRVTAVTPSGAARSG
ncbi:MAG: ferric reductase-like transmembrane domain-containing protein [Verrucomicrobia bacterium]|nr:ferric reductase-like transmembrane domain-containing protein [Verrucomicrobiota bacterium]